MTSFQEQQGELEDGELQETSVFDVSHPPPPTTTMWTASHRDERGGPVSSHLVPSYSHSFPPTTTTTTASSSFSSHHHPSRGRKRPPKRGMPRMTCPTSRTNNNNNNNDGGTSFPPHVASIVGGMDPLGTNTTTTSMVNIGDQVIQVISSLLAQGFQVPMDWFQNPQIYQWLVEWVRQSKSAELATTNKSSWAPPPSSCETPSGWTLGTTKTMDDHKESPGESIGTNNNYSMNNKKNNHESYPSMMPTDPKKSRPYTKKIPKKPKKSRNWTIYTTPRKQQEDDNTKLENCPNEQPQEMTTHEQYQHTEPKKQSSTLEELRNQAKMALKSSVDNATRDVVNKASQELSSAKQQQVTNHEEKEPGKTTTSPKENPSSSSLVITVEDSESNHSASGGDEKNTSRSRWSTLEELRRRVQELEERKKQYLQKRAKSTEEEHKKKIAKSNHLFSDSTLPLSSTPTMTTTTPKEETQRKEEQDDHSEEAKAWMERLEREAARAWEEHDKSITEEIEARNKLIRMRTCEETARESSRILKELWKKSRMDIQQYARQANAMEKQIEQIEVSLVVFYRERENVPELGECCIVFLGTKETFTCYSGKEST